MPSFVFKARDRGGRTQQGALAADSAGTVVNRLRERGWLVLDVRAAAAARSGVISLRGLAPHNWLPPRSVDVELSLRQEAVMLRSGITLLGALNMVAEQSSRTRMRRIWSDVAARIQEGASLADAMSHHSRFSSMVVQLVRVGEQTGHLEPVLTRAADALEGRRRMRFSVLTALAYPAIVLVSAIGVTAFMVLNVIPKLEKFLSAIGRKLPAMTQLLLDISRTVDACIVPVLAGAVVLAVALVALYLWPPGRMRIDRWLLRVPLLGTLLRLSGTVSFASGLAVLLQSGITLLEGLRTAERLQRNRQLAAQVAAARDVIMHGGTLAVPLSAPRGFMPMLSRMVTVGESAGTLDEVLLEVAKFYELQLQSAIRSLSVIIEPLIIIVVGGIVGFVYISFFMALFAAGGATK